MLRLYSSTDLYGACCTGIYLTPIPATLADDDTFVLEWIMDKKAAIIMCLEDDVEYAFQVQAGVAVVPLCTICCCTAIAWLFVNSNCHRLLLPCSWSSLRRLFGTSWPSATRTPMSCKRSTAAICRRHQRDLLAARRRWCTNWWVASCRALPSPSQCTRSERCVVTVTAARPLSPASQLKVQPTQTMGAQPSVMGLVM
jgi:hypothetical protein